MQAVCTLLWIDCCETYMVVIYPIDFCCHEKRHNGTFKKQEGLEQTKWPEKRHYDIGYALQGQKLFRNEICMDE